MKTVSVCAQAIWAKKHGDPPLWLPLFVHALDCADVAERLWENCLSDGVKADLAACIGSAEKAVRVLRLIALFHDCGKATPVFQASLLCRYRCRLMTN